MPLSLEDAQRLVENYVRHYNEIRLHSALGYVTPADKLAGQDQQIFAERDRKLETRTRTAAKCPRSSSASWLTDQELATVGVERYDEDGLGGGQEQRGDTT